MSLFVGEMTKGPETMAFFIDTSASADPVEEKNEAEEVEDVGESISGKKNRKLNKSSEKEQQPKGGI
mgnify:CR=1 FL=1